MSFNRKNIIYVVAFVVILFGSLIYKLVFKGIIFDFNKEDSITASQITESEQVDSSSDSLRSVDTSETFEEETSYSSNVTYKVYICGQVISPGVYEIDKGMLLCDVVDMAGGFTDAAPVECINLVYEIEGNISVYIPTAEELTGSSSESAIFRDSQIFMWGGNISSSEPVIPEEAQETKSNLININTASKEELMTLPGIGEATADAIITYRNSNPFNSVEDLMNVPGVGDSRYGKVKDLISVK